MLTADAITQSRKPAPEKDVHEPDKTRENEYARSVQIDWKFAKLSFQTEAAQIISA